MNINKIARQYYKIFPKRLGNYWKNLKDAKKLNKDLIFITENFITSKSYSLVSNYWHVLAINSYNNLIKFGLGKYGSTISKNFHTFADLNDDYVADAIKKIKKTKIYNLKTELFKIHNNFTTRESFLYNYICFLLYFNLKKTKCFKFLKKLKDKTYLGYDDPHIKINKLNISTDKLFSLFDYEKISRAFNLSKIKTILEIGAGSGRTTEAILSIKKDLKYIICDIPPSIYISFKRLKKAFPKKNISIIVDLNNIEEIKQQIKNNDLIFIFPHQLEYLEKNSIDLTIAIDCIHEMDKKTIHYYFNLINKFSKNFYFSIWKKTTVPYANNFFSKNKLIFEDGDYKVPKSWKNIFKENLLFPSNYLSLSYKTNKR